MSEEEILGRIAYEAYYNTWRSNGRSFLQIEWDKMHPTFRQVWIAVAKAVAERVLAEVQVAEEASE